MKKVMVAVMTFVMAVSFMASQESIPKIEMVGIPGMNIKMLKTEVTQELYESVMGNSPKYFVGDDRPIECISWYDAIYFCNKLSEMEGKNPVYAVDGETDVKKWGYTPHEWEEIEDEITQNTEASGYRLPTYDEWTYAAKGGENYTYAGSNNLDEVAWYDDNSDDKTHPVAQKKPNGYGLYDMTGNVCEWVWDSGDYGNRYYCGGSYCRSAICCEVDYADDCELDFLCSSSALSRGGGVGIRLVCPSK